MKQITYSFPQMISRSTKKTTMSTENKSINECLGILLRTRPGELLGDPNYGCLAIERVFMYNGVIIEELIREDIIDAIDKYEPRIIVNPSDIQIIQNVRTLNIYIQYTVKDTNQVNEYNMEIDYNQYQQ